MQRSAYGFWLADAGPATPCPRLSGEHSADVVVIGGGYLGMWTAWHLAEAGAQVVVLEADLCGHGPSGRNGGFLNGLWDRLAEMAELFGEDGALRVARASTDSLNAIAEWCTAQEVDAHVVLAPMLEVATAPRHEGSWDEAVSTCRALGAGEEVREIDSAQARAICDSPAFRSGVLWTSSGTVHPARLALGLRARLLERGVRIFERSAVARLDDHESGVHVQTHDGAAVRAGAAVLAVNAASAGVRPLRRSLSVASSSVVATAPVPELLERLGWTGGESIVDCRTLLHYFRTTRDGRVVFGWGGGRMGMGARRRRVIEVDPQVQDATAADLAALLPALRDGPIEHAWGGPIDVSPVHLPWFGSVQSVHYGFGFTGNGVVPTELGGRILTALSQGVRTDLTDLPIVGGLPPKRFPPEPLRFLGGSAIRAAHVRRDDAEAAGRTADPLTRAISALPSLLGLHLPR